MANTFLETGRPTTPMATSNVENNVNQANNQAQQPVQNNVNGTTGVGQNQSSAVNPITIPIQIQPQIAPTGQPQTTQTQNLQVQNTQPEYNAPTPQQYQGNTQNNNVVDFNQIYNSYQQAKGVNNQSQDYGVSGIKKTSFNTPIITPTTTNLNSVEGQYQSAYADTINGVISELLTQTQKIKTGFDYDPSQDDALRLASEYAANRTLQSLAGSGVLNSSATSERVARIVSELIPQYEEKSFNRQLQYLSQLANTAQLVMSFDNQQFQYWKDAKDREFENKKFDYQKQQDALENAWKRVDELGYVDNDASAVLGVAVGTLSGQARLAKEQREFELQKMREQAQIKFENSKALAKIRTELETNQSKELANYNYTLQQKYGTTKSSGNSNNYTSLSTHDDIIKNRWAEYDDFTKKYTITDSASAYNYLKNEYASGRISTNDVNALMSKYGIGNSGSGLSSTGQKIYSAYKTNYEGTSKSNTVRSSFKSNLSRLVNSGAITQSDYSYIVQDLGL